MICDNYEPALKGVHDVCVNCGYGKGQHKEDKSK